MDRRALFECYLIASGFVHDDDPAIAVQAAKRLRTAKIERGEALDEMRHIWTTILDSGLERCPHGQPLGVDLAIPHPFQAMPDLIVYGNDQDPPAFDGHLLTLLAGPAHGSGLMPWTRALLQAVARYVQAGDRVADVGSGTGILGLYAALQGAAAVESVDIDPISIAITRRNGRRNQLDSRVKAYLGSTEALTGLFDIGIVSLQAVYELPPVLDGMVHRMRPGGWLITSPAEGQAEADQLVAQLRDVGVEEVETIDLENWFVGCGRLPV